MPTILTLRRALLANALFSLACGLLLLFAPATVGALLGWYAPVLLQLIGVGLILFAIDLVHQATRPRPTSWRALYASVADGLWVVGSIAAVLLLPHDLSDRGVAIVLTVAGIVLGFGAWQLWGIHRAHYSRASGLYRHCLVVEADAPADALWSIIRDLSAIKDYMPTLKTSELLDNRAPGIGAVRCCTDQADRRWSEECTDFSDTERCLVVRFLADAPDFPFPVRYMIGGWTVTAVDATRSRVEVWWELAPKPWPLAPLLMPMLAFQADRDFPAVMQRMAMAASDRERLDTTGLGGRLLPMWC
ncbi:hypothetical protein J2T55_000663 [Methylohalomonas lacus]|uniref:SRPBCC family protein n=1 Tax=Methylohalomonas lacus TaxID=398773 RepID=A0AAE3HI04_9GAMM|nr:SRPBCC family protein [Methylohalomonas lacus]MCS3902659.1 hypothetical protein [Methylohalomonas lacus]